VISLKTCRLATIHPLWGVCTIQLSSS